jgi:hypothetical protein
LISLSSRTGSKGREWRRLGSPEEFGPGMDQFSIRIEENFIQGHPYTAMTLMRKNGGRLPCISFLASAD